MQRILERLSVLVVAYGIVACSSSPEAVFQRQNKAAATLARMSMEIDPQQSAKLDRVYAAEKRLHDACEPLQQTAASRMSDTSATAESEVEALASLDACERETQRVERFIRREAPESVQLNLGP